MTEFDVKIYNTLEPWQPQIFAQFCLLLMFCTMKRKNINFLLNLNCVKFSLFNFKTNELNFHL